MKNLREWLPSEQKEGSLWVRSTNPVSSCDGAPALILCGALSCRCCRGSTPRARRRWHAAVSPWSGWMENGVKRMRNSSRQSWMLMLSPTSSSFSMRGPVSMLLPTRCAIYGSTQSSLNSISMLILWSLFSSDERGWLRKWRRLSECWAGFLGHSQHPRDERVTPQVEGCGLPQHWGLPLALQSGVHSLAWAYQGGITVGSLPLTGTGPTELPWFLFIYFFYLFFVHRWSSQGLCGLLTRWSLGRPRWWCTAATAGTGRVNSHLWPCSCWTAITAPFVDLRCCWRKNGWALVTASSW